MFNMIVMRIPGDEHHSEDLEQVPWHLLKQIESIPGPAQTNH